MVSRSGRDGSTSVSGPEGLLESGVGDAADDDIVKLARGGGLNLVGALVSQSALFLITIALARRLGREGVGLYSQAFAFLALLGLLSLSGFRAGLTRFVAVHRVDGDMGALRGTVRLGLTLSTGTAALLGAALYAIAPWLAERAFSDPALATPLRFVALALPATVFTDAALSATQGFKTMRPFATIGMMLEPGLRLVLTVVLLAFGAGLGGAMAALTTSSVVSAVLAALSLRRLLGQPTAPPIYRLRELLSFSTVSWLASLASSGLIWADTILLGLYRPAADVGVYQVASRLVMLASLSMQPINSSLAPRIADLFRRQRMDTLKQTYQAAASWMTRLALPGFITLMIFPRELLELFGGGFAAGAAVVLILALGKMTDVVTGPCGLMLNMSGRVVLQMVDNVGVLVLNVALNLWLIPTHGIIGSAVAWAACLVVVNVARACQVWLTMRMLPFATESLKGVAAAVAGLLVGVGVHQALDGAPALIAGSIALTLTYLGMVVILGVPMHDRLVLESVLARWRRGAV